MLAVAGSAAAAFAALSSRRSIDRFTFAASLRRSRGLHGFANSSTCWSAVTVGERFGVACFFDFLPADLDELAVAAAPVNGEETATGRFLSGSLPLGEDITGSACSWLLGGGGLPALRLAEPY